MRINSVQMSNAFVIIKMCYVHNQWYDISCATLYIIVCDVQTYDVSPVTLCTAACRPDVTQVTRNTKGTQQSRSAAYTTDAVSSWEP